MPNNILLTPPVAFMIILAVTVILAGALSAFSCKVKKPPRDMDSAYACGEEVSEHRVQPDYSQFFPFAFFFTILHVVAMMVTTVPAQTIQTFSIAVIYIAGAVVGLFILFRK
jgi:NADH-quinone oxidoreductase subunit A